MRKSHVKRLSTVCGSTLIALAAGGVITFGQAHSVAADVTKTGADNVSAMVMDHSGAQPTTQQTQQTVSDDQQTTVDTNSMPTASASVTTPQTAQQVVMGPAVYNVTNADALDLSWMNGGMNEGTFVQIRNQGVKYVIIQLTKGTYLHDPYAEEQVRDAYAAGLGVSAYHFAKFNSRGTAIAEANYFADRADQLHLPKNTLMFADVEDPLNKYPGVVNDLRAFFDQLNARGYWNHGVYTGQYFDSVYHVSSVVGRNRTWIAQYPADHQATPARRATKAAMGYGAWQYTGYNGGYKVAGYDSLDGTVDLGLLSSAIAPGFTSAANLDRFDIDTANQQVNISGWFASYGNRGKDGHHFVILLDNKGHEIARQKVQPGQRADVKNAYYYLYGAEKSGYMTHFSLDNPVLARAIANGEPLSIIFRSTESVDGNSNFNDYWFQGQSLNKNLSCLDDFTVNNGRLHLSGWHIADQSINQSSLPVGDLSWPNDWLRSCSSTGHYT